MSTDRRHLLKLKLKSLAAEAKILRQAESCLQFQANPMRLAPHAVPDEIASLGDKAIAAWFRAELRDQRKQWREKPWYGENRERLNGMQLHRTVELREAARATHLAYGFIRGKTYRQIEGNRMIRKDLFGNMASDENRVFEAAAKMAWFYGASKSKSDTIRDVLEWMEKHDVALTVENGVNGLIWAGPRPPDTGGTALAAPGTP
jgi:hypothetical protein